MFFDCFLLSVCMYVCVYVRAGGPPTHRLSDEDGDTGFYPLPLLTGGAMQLSAVKEKDGLMVSPRCHFLVVVLFCLVFFSLSIFFQTFELFCCCCCC